jgi:molecular chaperone GrpE (heat shock protein)
MPKLDGTHIVERLIKRIAELEAGEEVAAKDIRALLNAEQQKALDNAWGLQEKLRLETRARTDAEKAAVGWKSKREVRIEILRQALSDAKTGEVDAWKKKMRDAEIRQARIYFDSLNAAEKAGKDKQAAQNFANNELTRAGLRRMDDLMAAAAGKRDRNHI